MHVHFVLQDGASEMARAQSPSGFTAEEDVQVIEHYWPMLHVCSSSPCGSLLGLYP